MSSRRGLASVGNRSRSLLTMAAVSSTDSVVWVTNASRSGSRTCELLGLLHVLDEMHVPAEAGVEASHGAFDFRVPGMPDQHHVAGVARITRHFHVHLGDQRTGGVEDRESAARGLLLDGRRHAMRGENHRGAVRNLVELVDEHGAELAQPLDHVHVVHHFVPHVDRRAEHRDGAFDDVDGAIDPGAESSRIGEQDLHLPPAIAAARLSRRSLQRFAQRGEEHAGRADR